MFCSYRPLEVKRELDDVKVSDVVAHDRGEGLSEGALLLRVHHHLVVLEADAEPGPALSGAGVAPQHDGAVGGAVAAVAVGVAPEGVLEGL